VEPGLEGPRGRQTDARIEERAGGGGGRAQFSSGMTELPLPLWLCLCARRSSARAAGGPARVVRSLLGVGLDPVHGGGVAGNDDGLHEAGRDRTRTVPQRPAPFRCGRRQPPADVRATAPVGSTRECEAGTRAAGLSACCQWSPDLAFYGFTAHALRFVQFVLASQLPVGHPACSQTAPFTTAAFSPFTGTNKHVEGKNYRFMVLKG
jgi:hypothetical protein